MSISQSSKILIINVPPIKQIMPISAGVAYLKGYLDMFNVDNNILDFNDEFFNAVTIDHTKNLTKVQDHFYIYQDIMGDLEAPIEFLESVVQENIDLINAHDVLAFSVFDNLGFSVFKKLYSIFENKGLMQGKEVIVGGNFFLHYGNGSRYKDQWNVCTEPIEDFFGFGEIRRHDYMQYIPDADRGRIPLIRFSEGCQYRCKFCPHHKLYDYKIKHRDHNTVIKEIIKYTSAGYKHFWLGAENIGANKKETEEFLTRLSRFKGRMDFTWRANFSSHLDGINYSLLRKAGCSLLLCGIESFSEEVRRAMNKPRHSNEDLWEFGRQLRQNKISTIMNIITGFPSETNEQFEDGLVKAKAFISEFKDVINVVELYSFYVVADDSYCGYEVQFDENGDWYYNENTKQVRNYRFNRYIEELNDLL